MKDYLLKHPWKIIEDKFHRSHNCISESIFSVGNGYMGVRGTFEEHFSGDSLQGSYISGIYYPDKTRVGWWKNGYPEYFAKVLNSVNWIGINLYINGELLDYNQAEIIEFRRELDMKHSIFKKDITIRTLGGQLSISSERCCCLDPKELALIRYTIRSIDFVGDLKIESYLDADVMNQDANYDESFWDILDPEDTSFPSVRARTKKTGFEVYASMYNETEVGISDNSSSPGKTFESITISMTERQETTLHKYVAINTSFHQDQHLGTQNNDLLKRVQKSGYKAIISKHKELWDSRWEKNDIEVSGDVAAQQALRFNILQLYQTYDGKDNRLNIGPKGFTGEKYGGCTYWDTEAYCLPFYMSTADPSVARSLLVYRYNHLQKAIENAAKLGFGEGAALYPMVTMNGEECHNEWEITFEEIHRNGAIAYAIYNYVNYTEDRSYLGEHGLEVLIGIARFWSQRFQYSMAKKAYVILGVTGPNEYENNVNNNWYTNYIGRWCLQYCIQVMDELNKDNTIQLASIIDKIKYQEEERNRWQKIIDNTYLPYDTERQVFLQQDGFLDKDLQAVSALQDTDTPINQNWSWDRILRSCYIKQADVLQGMYLFEDHFNLEEIKRNFEFYEPMTVHESSLSPCIHAVLACRIGRYDKAYELFMRTARLDLDDYNNDTEDGLHITSMAGTWLAIIQGFGGMNMNNGTLSFYPELPDKWESMSFRIVYRQAILKITCRKSHDTAIENLSRIGVDIIVYNQRYRIDGHTIIQINR